MVPFALNEEQRQEAAMLYEEKRWSARQIAAHFQISTTAARNALRAQGVAFRSKSEGRMIRDEFPNKRYPNGRPHRSANLRRLQIPSVFHLAECL